MVNIRTQNDIALALIDFFKIAAPKLTTSPGSTSRDLFVDAPSSQLALLYNELSKISALQSLRTVAGSDLDKLAQNFGATRKKPVQASGTALFTFSSIPAVVSINKGNTVTAYTGATFSVINGISVNPAQLNTYRATAIKYQNNLNFLNNTDQYAVEVSVIATTAGSSGNIPSYTINSTAIPGVSHVTNVFPFTGGADQETDAAFRNRVLAIFSGSNVGTALGYKNTALSVSSVLDAIVVGPGSPLMTRDGTIVEQNSDGSFIILSDGTGGKVDVQILGTVLSSHTDSFIYLDKSNTNDPTNTKNIVLLGQIPGEISLTIPERRVQDIANNVLPAQPVQEILQVSGSSSGANFLPKSTDIYGRVSGNYELIKDTANYAGSPWAQDSFHWVSNNIAYQENDIKSGFNGQDPTSFTGVLSIPKVQQNISITNENSLVSATDHSMITLLHTPATNVTRVFNTNTGERYTILNNLSTAINTTGIIQISGNTLPSLTDILQIDYTWIVSYDSYSDYDGKLLNNNIRSNVDSIDWSMANAVRNERILFTQNSTKTLYIGNSTHPISYVVSADIFSSTVGVVSQSAVPNFLTRYAVVLTNLPAEIDNITGIKLTNTEEEIYDTAQADGFIINSAGTIVVNDVLFKNVTVVLPSDTIAITGQSVTVEYNDSDVFNIVNSTGNFLLNEITIPFVNIQNSSVSIYLDVSYITSVQNVLTAGITNFPLSRSGNGFLPNTNTGSINAIQSNTIKKENQTIQKNLSNQFYVTLSISSNNFSFDGYDVISVIDLTSGLEVWNVDFPGTVSISSNGNYELIFSGFNSPQLGDNVLALYFADDLTNTQPFTFHNDIINKNFQTAQFNFTANDFYVPVHNFILENGLTFNVIDTTTGLSIGSDIDGYIYSTSSNASIASFSSTTFNFGTVVDITGKILQIYKPSNRNNDGFFNILSYNNLNNSINIGVISSSLDNDQISVIRIADGKDLWNNKCSIDSTNNLLIFPSTTLVSAGDKVIVLLFTNKNLHQSPTKLTITTTDQNNNTGKIVVTGTTITKVNSVVFSAIENGLSQDLTSAIITSLGKNSNYSLPPNISICRIVSLKKVSTTTGNVVLSNLATYDVFGSKIANNIFYQNEMIENSSLSNTEFILPSTANNLANSPKIGDQFEITFYYTTAGDSESVYFTRNGTLYTNKEFALIDQVYVASGFNTSQSAKFTFGYFTQPATGSTYTSFYNYTAPKENERIAINYNYNQLIANVTFAIENTRPITADVLVKAAQEILVDATINIVVSSNYVSSAPIVIQNVQNAIINAINTNKLGATLNSSDLIVAAQSVSGIERSRILAFNIDGKIGQVLTLQAQSNQYFVANIITINQESI